MKLIIFAGLPGTGKSALAEAVGRELGIPVFAKDWLEATLLGCELAPANQDRPLGMAGYDLLSMLAERQLMLEQSAILDSVASTSSIRVTWQALADQYDAQRRVVECVCSDQELHRSRLGGRRRNIPGWHELERAEVERVRGYYVPWAEQHLVLDAVQPFETNLKTALAYCA